jgi:prolyl-tRNA editing enzyme YbaK/EbsC (Cys-tRNA(Pro) deacylase)
MTATAIDADRVAALQVRVATLERKHFQCPPQVKTVDEAMRRARLHVESAPCYSAVWKYVPEPFYTWELAARAVALEAPSVDYLCKSLLMDNRKVPALDQKPHDPTNPKFVLVILQYAATLDDRKLTNSIRALRPLQERLDVNQFDFRIASEQDNAALTGYEHNSVTPFGLLQPDQLSIVLAAPVNHLPFFYMGGGHVHLKLGMATSDFCSALRPIVADISQPRAATAASLVKKDLDAGVTQADKDLQRIMAQRREQSDSTGGMIDPITGKDIELLKSVEMSSDLKAIMERRRNMSGN